MLLQLYSVLAVHRHWWTKEIKDHDSRKENTILVCRTTDSNEHRNGSLSGVHHTKRGKRSSDIYWAGISACRVYLRTWLLHRQVEETNRESLTRSSFCFHCWKERKSETAFPPFLFTQDCNAEHAKKPQRNKFRIILLFQLLFLSLRAEIKMYWSYECKHRHQLQSDANAASANACTLATPNRKGTDSAEHPRWTESFSSDFPNRWNLRRRHPCRSKSRKETAPCQEGLNYVSSLTLTAGLAFWLENVYRVLLTYWGSSTLSGHRRSGLAGSAWS